MTFIEKHRLVGGTTEKEMLKIVRRLSDEGQIVLGGGGDDQFL